MNPSGQPPRHLEPAVGVLRVVDGARADAVPGAVAFSPPPQVARDRRGERLFVLLDLAGKAGSRLHRELREVVARTYWTTPGSITAVLRQAAAAANRHLYQANLHASPPDRSYAGLACGVLHGNDVFVLLAGPALACVLREGHLELFPREGDLRQLGVGPLPDERLYHAFFSIGDTLLLSSAGLAHEAGEVGIARVLPRPAMDEVLVGLEQLGGRVDFTALVARLALPPGGARSRPPRKKAAEAPQASTPARTRLQETPSPSPRVVRRAAEPEPAPEERSPEQERPRRARRERAEPPREAGPGLGERLSGLDQRVRAGATSAGRGAAAAGRRLAGSLGGLFRSMLPGPERDARRRTRRSRVIPRENRTVMMGLAIGIPLLVALAVALAYRTFGVEARFQGLVSQAAHQVSLAQAAGDDLVEARVHWDAALTYAAEAVDRRPDDQEAVALKRQAQTALDLYSGVVRLDPLHLMDFGGSGGLLRRLVTHGPTIVVLDPEGDWVIQLTLNRSGDGVLEEGIPLPFIRAGQEIDDGEVGGLVDLVWVGAEGDRLTGGLLVLEEGGALVGHDPAWGGDGNAIRLTRSLLGTPPTGESIAADTYLGRLYVLDPVARQLWRYAPRGDVYPDPPDRYFITAPAQSLEAALDVAIDGHVYILYRDGTILKFMDRESRPFEVRGLPDEIEGAVGLAVDPNGSRGLVYVADRGGAGGGDDGRVIVLEPDGAFLAQYRAEGVLGELEALAVDEAAGRLLIFSGGHLYVAYPPPLP